MKGRSTSILLGICLLLAACAQAPPPQEPVFVDAGFRVQVLTPIPAASASPPPTPSATPEPSPTPPPPEEVIISFIGDCTLGGDPLLGQLDAFDRALEANGGDMGYFFRNALPYTGEDSLTIANLEGPLTDRQGGEIKEFAFRGHPAYAAILTQGGVEAVSLPNNHTLDFGQGGYEDTLAALSGQGVAYADVGMPAVFAAGRWRIGIAASKFPIKERNEQLARDIAWLLEEGCDRVVVMIHGGKEGTYTPTADMRTAARAAIDAGADVVAGHHPHVLHGIEVYQGKIIAYSLGNFVFGGNRNPSERETAILQVRYAVLEDDLVAKDFRLLPFTMSPPPGNSYQPAELHGEERERFFDLVNQRNELMDSPLILLDGWQDQGA